MGDDVTNPTSKSYILSTLYLNYTLTTTLILFESHSFHIPFSLYWVFFYSPSLLFFSFSILTKQNKHTPYVTFYILFNHIKQIYIFFIIIFLWIYSLHLFMCPFSLNLYILFLLLHVLFYSFSHTRVSISFNYHPSFKVII